MVVQCDSKQAFHTQLKTEVKPIITQGYDCFRQNSLDPITLSQHVVTNQKL